MINLKISHNTKSSQKVPGGNLINIQQLGLRLRLEKGSKGMQIGLRLRTIFESYKHGLEAYFRT